jgi:CheY-like chemotaxis protein
VSVFRLVFEKVGYAFGAAGSAAEGLDAIERFVPDLIILDVIMEDFVAGFRVVSELRADPRGRYARYSSIPIVMLTSVTTKTQIDFAERVGTALLPVDVFIEKPVKPADMLAIVESTLARSTGLAGGA